ncbi:MAG: hypothetical protein PHP51_05475 [Desulfotomaculaceae bacterium]|nr:hypothetical protein [Desulfotomaculaceae bacterium]
MAKPWPSSASPNLDFAKFKEIGAGEYFFDLRNIYDKKVMLEKGFKYYGVGV